MTYVLYAIIAVVLAFVVFVLWRLTSVVRGGRQRDTKIAEVLFPLVQKLQQGEPVTADEVAALAAQPQYRPMLYGLLQHLNRVDLFPEKHLDQVSQGAARLAYWMMHPNELQDPPESIELVESIDRKLSPSGREGTFHVYRYKMPAGHWAGDDWILGLAGPFMDDDTPFLGPTGAFSRCGDKLANVKPSELVDWYIDMAQRKGAPWTK